MNKLTTAKAFYLAFNIITKLPLINFLSLKNRKKNRKKNHNFFCSFDIYESYVFIYNSRIFRWPRVCKALDIIIINNNRIFVEKERIFDPSSERQWT